MGYFKKYNKERRAMAKAQGICVYCIKRRARPHSVVCQPCIDKITVSGKKRRERLKSEGRCNCGQKFDRGGARCEKCHEKFLEWQ